ncbi:hypothetical protein BK120_23405 [Paenibacillus sp. FSL A5-0031]|uniref:hypothetical protein n=1 Tax=Paenibacillus sp. FSL A5-0031 TaxID=1920420 RepID=UPI00096F6AF1|nr:hypothetical protein [Paenibacillus sp. FSL A5-0031]OME78689.1 hypothetical protein BK120_23405 [Paenibacillus sp. FSL A5-0031]
MSDWYLEAIDGTEHKASFVKATAADAKNMKWTSGLSWLKEVKNITRSVYKLVDKSGTILGGLSISDEDDHIFIHLVESAPHMRSGVVPPRYYVNIPRLLIGFAGKTSIDLGYDGFLALTPKTNKRDYFATQFNAVPVYGRNMGIYGVVSSNLVGLYYK